MQSGLCHGKLWKENKPNGRQFLDPLYSFLAFTCIVIAYCVSLGSICRLV